MQSVAFDFSEESLARMRALQEQVGAESLAQTVRISARLLEWVLAHPGVSLISLSDESGNLLDATKIDELLKV